MITQYESFRMLEKHFCRGSQGRIIDPGLTDEAGGDFSI